MMKRLMCLVVLLMCSAGLVNAGEGFIVGDPLPDAPELAARGNYSVGVRTLQLVNPGQIDLASSGARYDRPLTVEVWYPAIIPDGSSEITTYDSYLGRADQGDLVPFTFAGRALRDAEPDSSGGAYPLVIVSHGYPGTRVMMSYLTENLASKGYVVAAIDHTASTLADVGSFFITLLHRAADQNFVLGEMARLSDEAGFLNGLVDAGSTAIIGYSMGGYGALNAAGAGYNRTLQRFLPAIESRMEGNEAYESSVDPRLKAIVVFAPWGGDLTTFGMPGGSFWDAEALATIQIPSLWIAGDLDDVSTYASVVRMFDSAVNSDRYLLTYQNAYHNVAPNPPPPAAVDFPDYTRYSEPAWDERRLNNINQHFVTAFLDQVLKGVDNTAYLNPPVENANDGVARFNPDGTPHPSNTYWAGFLSRTAAGLSLRPVPALSPTPP